MALTVHRNQVMLNGVRYPLLGLVRPERAAVWPQKQVFGDYTMDTDPYLSHWIINDQRGGILVEERNGPQHDNRCWWSSCNLAYRGHILLAPYANLATLPTMPTLTDDGLEDWASATDLTSWIEFLSGGGSAVDRDDTDENAGTYCAKLTGGAGAGRYGEIYQNAANWTNNFRGATFIITAYMKSDAANTASLVVTDGTDTTQTYHTGGGSYEKLTVVHTVNAAGVRLRVHLRGEDNAGASHVAYADGPMTISALGTVGKAWVNFNSITYFSAGQCLMKIDSSGNLLFVKDMAANITDLVASEDNSLYIFLGDDTSYEYMTTGEVFTVAVGSDGGGGGTSSAATKGVHFDAKLLKMDSEGATYSATDPSSATPTWTGSGSLADAGLADNDVHAFGIYRDADGTPIAYAASKQGLFAHDFGSTLWAETELTYPNHPTAGRGFVWWRDALYVTAGLDVIKYIAARTATIQFVGLNKDDGLPAKYRGEITRAIKGYSELYVLVDSSLASGAGYSGMYVYDGVGWQNWWVASAAIFEEGADKVMNGGIVSSAFGYRLWFDHNNFVYYMNLQRDIRNPSQISNFAYALDGLHITSWFDADWASENKTALNFKITITGASSDETVLVKYRINHTNTDRDTGWTTLGTIIADGQTTYTFGTNDVGIEFKAIQFRFELARGSTDTNSPDIRSFALGFLKNVPTTMDIGGGWAYRFLVDCTRAEYFERSGAQLYDALRTAAESTTLIQLAFRNDAGGTETYYGQVRDVRGAVQTGETKTGQFEVYLVVP